MAPWQKKSKVVLERKLNSTFPLVTDTHRSHRSLETLWNESKDVCSRYERREKLNLAILNTVEMVNITLAYRPFPDTCRRSRKGPHTLRNSSSARVQAAWKGNTQKKKESCTWKSEEILRVTPTYLPFTDTHKESGTGQDSLENECKSVWSVCSRSMNAPQVHAHPKTSIEKHKPASTLFTANFSSTNRYTWIDRIINRETGRKVN